MDFVLRIFLTEHFNFMFLIHIFKILKMISIV